MMINNKNNKNTYNKMDWSLIEEKWRQRWEKTEDLPSRVRFCKEKIFYNCSLPLPKFTTAFGTWENLHSC